MLQEPDRLKRNDGCSSTQKQKKKKNGAFDNSDIIRQLCDFKEITGEQLQEKLLLARLLLLHRMKILNLVNVLFHISITGADQFFLTGIDPITLVLNCRDIASGTFSFYLQIRQN